MNADRKRMLSDYVGDRDNNLNLIRFIAATMVIFTHSFALTLGSGGTEPFRQLSGIPLGQIAVDVFFVTSGFLITASFLRSSTIWRYAWARILRIYPALIVAVLFTTFVVGGWFSYLDLSEYYSSPEVYDYVMLNSTLLFGLQGHLSGVFTDLPYANAVNGSLWTLPWEVRMYVMVAIFGIIALAARRFSEERFLLALVIVTFMVAIVLHLANHAIKFTDHKQLQNGFRLVSMFFYGSSMYLLKDKIALNSVVFYLIATAFVLTIILDNSIFYYAYYLLIGCFLLFIAYVPVGFLRKFNQVGDYSYRLYIYAFPVQKPWLHQVWNFRLWGCSLFLFSSRYALPASRGM